VVEISEKKKGEPEGSVQKCCTFEGVFKRAIGGADKKEKREGRVRLRRTEKEPYKKKDKKSGGEIRAKAVTSSLADCKGKNCREYKETIRGTWLEKSTTGKFEATSKRLSKRRGEVENPRKG